MDKLSSLLNEAKPLYKTRKRNKIILKTSLCTLFPVILLVFCIQICNMGNDIYLAMNDNSFQQEIINDDFDIFGVK